MKIEKMARLEREELIRRLKAVKDPRERDRILLLLADREEAVRETRTSAGPIEFRIPDTGRTGTRPPDQSSPPAEAEQSPTQMKIGKLIGYAFPLFFLIAGAVFTLEMLAEVGDGKPLQEAFMENPTGIFLIFFGLLGLIKNRKAKKQSQNI